MQLVGISSHFFEVTVKAAVFAVQDLAPVSAHLLLQRYVWLQPLLYRRVNLE